MNDMTWTPKLVEARLAEAAAVLKRLPEPRVQGYFHTWPAHLIEFSDLVEQAPTPMSPPAPSPAAITRMEETLGWTIGLDAVDGKIAWMRAHGVSVEGDLLEGRACSDLPRTSAGTTRARSSP